MVFNQDLFFDPKKVKIGFIGAGKITESLIQGLQKYGKVEPSRMHVAAPTTKNLERLKQQFGGLHITKRNLDIFARYGCDVVFICVHGSVIRKLYKQGDSHPWPLTTSYWVPNMKKPLFILSVVTGYSLKEVMACLLHPDHPGWYIVEAHRIVINTACAYGVGICAIDVALDGLHLSKPVRALLSTVSKLEYLPENQMDAACAVYGAGLAISYYFINAMSDGATKMGLSRQMATKLAAKTVQSGAQSLLESGKYPNELRDEVCSPAGPAIYGIHALDKADVFSSVSAAVEAAHKRAAQLAKDGN